MFRKPKYLALCDKASQVVQLACMAKMFPRGLGSINIGYEGKNLIIVVVDTLGNNSAAEHHLREELDESGLSKASIVHYQRNDVIYTGDYSTADGIQRVITHLHEKLPRNIEGIFCSLLSQRFVKIHLGAYPEAPVFLLEDGLASYLDIPIKVCATLVDQFTHKGVVSAHLKRVHMANLPITEANAPASHLKKRFVQFDVDQQKFQYVRAVEKCYIGLNPRRRSMMHSALMDYWQRRAGRLEGDWRPQAVVLGQNFSDFCEGFYFRDEVEMYAETCRRLFNICDRVMFIPHPKSPARLAKLMAEKVSGDLVVHRDPSTPAEAFFVRDNPPAYAVGYYSTAMWNIQEILGGETYTALGWGTRRLYGGLQHDIQRQAYRAARQKFFPLEKLEVDQKVASRYEPENILAKAS